MSDSRLLLWLVVLAVLVVTAHGGKSGKGGSKGGRGGKGGGDEEIIIPLGTETVIPMGGFGGGGGGGGFEIPLDPAMFAGPQGGGSGGPVGFEETEEIGPDGKPHIISEHQFGGAPAPKLTKAQRQQQKAMQKEMAVPPPPPACLLSCSVEHHASDVCSAHPPRTVHGKGHGVNVFRRRIRLSRATLVA